MNSEESGKQNLSAVCAHWLHDEGNGNCHFRFGVWQDAGNLYADQSGPHPRCYAFQPGAPFKKDNPDAASNPISRWKQKQAIKKEYAAAKAGKGTAKETAAKATKKAAQSTKTITEKVMEFCTTHSKTILFVLIAGLLFMILSGMFSSCSAMFQGGTQIVLGTSFTAKEEDIIGADNDYKALEAALRNEINNIERTHSGYDEYRYDLDEINHNPYELAAYLTVKFEDYTRDEVQATLQWLFEQQYELKRSCLF